MRKLLAVFVMLLPSTVSAQPYEKQVVAHAAPKAAVAP